MADPVSSLKVNVGVSPESKEALRQLITNIRGVGTAFRGIETKPVKEAKDSIAELTKEHEHAEKAADNFSERLSKENSQLSYVESAIKKVIEGTRFLVGGFLAIEALHVAKEIADVAAESERLGEALVQVAQNSGTSREEILGYDKQIQNLGYSAAESRNFLSHFIQANLDVAKAVEVASLAQNLSVVNGRSYAETVEELTSALRNGMPIRLRNLGLIVDTTQATKDYVNEVNSGSSGRKTSVALLSQEERAQITLNAALEAGKKYNGVYQASLGTVAGQMKELPGAIEKFKDSLGESLLPAYFEIVKVSTQLLKELGLVAEQSSTNTDASQKLAKVVGTVAEAFKDVAEFAIEHRRVIEAVLGVYVLYQGVIDPIRKLLVGLGETFVEVSSGIKLFAAYAADAARFTLGVGVAFVAGVHDALSYAKVLLDLTKAQGYAAASQSLLRAGMVTTEATASASAILSLRTAILGAVFATRTYIVELFTLAGAQGFAAATGKLLSDALAVTGITGLITGVTSYIRSLALLATTQGYAAVVTRILTGAVIQLDAALLANPLGAALLVIAAALALVAAGAALLLHHAKGLVEGATWTDLWHAGLSKIANSFETVYKLAKDLLTLNFKDFAKDLKVPSFKEVLTGARDKRQDEEAGRGGETKRPDSVESALTLDQARIRLLEGQEQQEGAHKRLERANLGHNLETIAKAEEAAKAADIRVAEDQRQWDKRIHEERKELYNKEEEDRKLAAARVARAELKVLEANQKATAALLQGGSYTEGQGFRSAQELTDVTAFQQHVQSAKEGTLGPIELNQLGRESEKAAESVTNPAAFADFKQAVKDLQSVKGLSTETNKTLNEGVARAALQVREERRKFNQPNEAEAKTRAKNTDETTVDAVRHEQTLVKIANEEILTTEKERYETGQTTLEDYFHVRRGILLKNYGHEQELTQASIKELTRQRALTSDPNARNEFTRQIQNEYNKQSESTASFNTSNANLNTEETKTQFEITKEILGIEVDTVKTIGSYGGAVDEINKKYDELREKTHQQGLSVIEAAREAKLFAAEVEHQNKLFEQQVSLQKAIQDNQKARLEAAKATGTITPAEYQETSNQLIREEQESLSRQRSFYEEQIVQKQRQITSTQENDTITRFNDPEHKDTDISGYETGITDLRTKIEGLNTEIITLGTGIQTYGKQIREGFTNDVSTAISTMLTDAGHAGDAVLNITKNLQKQFADIFAKNLATKLTQSLQGLNPDGTPKLDKDGKPVKSVFDSFSGFLGLGAQPKAIHYDGTSPSRALFTHIVNLGDLKHGASAQPGEAVGVINPPNATPALQSIAARLPSPPSAGGPLVLPPQVTGVAGAGGAGGAGGTGGAGGSGGAGGTGFGGLGPFAPVVGAGIGESGGDLIGSLIAKSSTWKHSPARPIAELQDRGKGRAIGGAAGAILGLLLAGHGSSRASSVDTSGLGASNLSAVKEFAGRGGPLGLESGPDLTSLLDELPFYASGGEIDTDGVDSNGLPKQWNVLLHEIKPIYESAGGSWEGLVNSLGHFGLSHLGKLFGPKIGSDVGGKAGGDPTELLGGWQSGDDGTFKDGGLPGYAKGKLPPGMIHGKGTGTSDSIVARVSNKEFITNAASTHKYLPLLQAINEDDMESLQSIALPAPKAAFATGGAVNSASPGLPPLPTPVAGGTSPGSGLLQVQLHPDALNMTMGDWLQKEAARQYAER